LTLFIDLRVESYTQELKTSYAELQEEVKTMRGKLADLNEKNQAMSQMLRNSEVDFLSACVECNQSKVEQ
jgi:chaperonin cofactor prefoldin